MNIPKIINELKMLNQDDKFLKLIKNLDIKITCCQNVIII